MMSSQTVARGNPSVVLEGRSASIITGNAVTQEIWSSVTEIDAAAWEHVRPADDVFLDLRLLKVLETSMSATSRFRFVLYRNESAEPVAIAVLSIFTIDIGVLADDPWSRWALGRLRRISSWLVNYRILFCGLPLSACQSSLRFAPGADTATIMTLLDRTLRRLAKQQGARVIVLKEFADEELPPLKPLEGLGYRKADSLPTHIVHLKSDSFEGFLGEMKSKRRHNIRLEMKKFAASGVEFVTTSDYAEIQRLFTAETYQMYERVLSRSKTQLEHLPPEFFLEMARQLPDCCQFVFGMKNNRVHAFSIGLRFGHEYRGLYMGYDESLNEQTSLYFNLVFRGIADAAAQHAQIVEVGQNSAYFKQTKLGAQPSRRSIYVRGGGPFMNGLIGVLFKQLFPARPLGVEFKDE